MLAADRFPVRELRAQFPSLARASDFIFFDNAAGAQLPRQVLDDVQGHLLDHNAQRGGRFRHSVAVDQAVDRARATIATFVNARRPEEIALGLNATSFIRTVSLAIGQSLDTRNEIVCTDLDHEANIGTWLALAPFGAKIVRWRMREDGNLHLQDLLPLLSARTRLVAVTLASNAIGSIIDTHAVADAAHAAGAEIFVDAVHYGPHGLIDVQAMECDYLVCSGYKIFAPHMGFLWGRYELLQALPTFREDFIPDRPPFKLEAGTFSYESVVGMSAAIEYLASVGDRLAAANDSEHVAGGDLLGRIRLAMQGIRVYEQRLSDELLCMLSDRGAIVYGITNRSQLELRVPTVSFNLPGIAPAAVAEYAADAGIGIRDGHLYTPRLMQALGLDTTSGAVRVSLVHYNTLEEIHRLGEVLGELTRRHRGPAASAG